MTRLGVGCARRCLRTKRRGPEREILVQSDNSRVDKTRLHEVPSLWVNIDDLGAKVDVVSARSSAHRVFHAQQAVVLLRDARFHVQRRQFHFDREPRSAIVNRTEMLTEPPQFVQCVWARLIRHEHCPRTVDVHGLREPRPECASHRMAGVVLPPRDGPTLVSTDPTRCLNERRELGPP
jgi:hypothetical protein